MAHIFMCVQLILFDNREKQCKIYWPSKFIVVFSSILLFSITVKEMYFENKWYLIEHKRKFGNIQEVIATYETLYPHLKKMLISYIIMLRSLIISVIMKEVVS